MFTIDKKYSHQNPHSNLLVIKTGMRGKWKGSPTALYQQNDILYQCKTCGKKTVLYYCTNCLENEANEKGLDHIVLS